MIKNFKPILALHKIILIAYLRSFSNNKNIKWNFGVYLVFFIFYVFTSISIFAAINFYSEIIHTINPLIFYFVFALSDLFIKSLFSKNICNRSYLQFKTIGLSNSYIASLIIYISNFSITHLLSLLLLFPVSVGLFIFSSSNLTSIYFAFNIFLVYFINNFIISFFDVLFFRKFLSRRIILPVLLIIFSDILLNVLETFINTLSHHLELIIIINISLLFLLLFFNHRLIKNYFYNFGIGKTDRISKITFLEISKLMSIYTITMYIEIIAIIRNKSARNIFLIHFLILFWIFIQSLISLNHQKDMITNNFQILTLYLYTSVIPSIFGQFILYWHSDYSYFISNAKISLNELIKTRCLMYYVFLFFSCLFSFLFNFIIKQDSMLILASAIFQIGVILPCLFLISLFYGTAVQLKQKNYFRDYGFNSIIGVLNFLMFSVPALLYVLFRSIYNYSNALYIISAIGVLGIIIQYLYKERILMFFENRKYLLSFDTITKDGNQYR